MIIFKQILKKDNYLKFIYFKMINTNSYSTRKFNVFVTQPIPKEAVDILERDNQINLKRKKKIYIKIGRKPYYKLN